MDIHLSTIPSLAQLHTTHDSIVLSIRQLSGNLKSSADQGSRLDILMGNVTRSLTEYTVQKDEYTSLLDSYKKAKVCAMELTKIDESFCRICFKNIKRRDKGCKGRVRQPCRVV
jgi:hypothetical protein